WEGRIWPSRGIRRSRSLRCCGRSKWKSRTERPPRKPARKLRFPGACFHSGQVLENRNHSRMIQIAASFGKQRAEQFVSDRGGWQRNVQFARGGHDDVQ